MASLPLKFHPPQAFMSTYAPRIRSCNNPLLVPVPSAPSLNRSKRNTTVVNYAEDGFDDSDFEDSDGYRRSTRTSRRSDHTPAVERTQLETGIEATEPVEFQGIWREWVGRAKRQLTERQVHLQSALPLHLIPIRIDVEIPAFRPDAAFPTPGNVRDFGIDESLPAYKPQDPTPGYRLKDFFLWNLHEALTTPDQFARVLVDELDLPQDRKPTLITQIATQIRQQLEEYAGIAMHPLFQTHISGLENRPRPVATTIASTSRAQSATPRPGQATAPGSESQQDRDRTEHDASKQNNFIVASAEEITDEDVFSPDDMYRCIIHLNISLLNQLYTDKFEWSLLHPPGFAEEFSRQTCADLGLSGEWASAITHAIYEAVLRLKKETCENGGPGAIGPGFPSTGTIGEVVNDAANGAAAGWRHDNDRLCDGWEPKIETLLKEDIERREGHRERQLRRMRRETARFSNVANLPTFLDFGGGAGGSGAADADAYGRSQRIRRRTTRIRSLSPAAGRDTPDRSGYGTTSFLTEAERPNWRCSHCAVWGSAVWAVRDGPAGPKSLCNNCGHLYEQHQQLPPWSAGLFASDRPAGR